MSRILDFRFWISDCTAGLPNPKSKISATTLGGSAKPVGGQNPKYLAFLSVFLLVAVLLVFPSVADACPGCKEALFDPAQLPQRLATARGYALSIGLFLTMPLALILVVATLIARAKRQTRR